MRAVSAGLLAALLIGRPAPGAAWGLDAHRLLTRRAIDGLPRELKPLFDNQRDFVVEHSIDPDEWRVAGVSGASGAESANHHLDLDALDEPAPFQRVPREWAAFVARYGRDRANKAGRLPWRAQEIYDRLAAAFRELDSPAAPYAADDVRYLSAVLAHYIEDAHVPFHATVNYDGQQTGQRGIHSRFETELVLRNLSALELAPVTIRPVGRVPDFVFAALADSHALAASLLEADRRAAVGREFYDDAYFAAFGRVARPIVQRRMSAASSAVASVIVSAWAQAGRPAFRADHPMAPARIRR